MALNESDLSELLDALRAGGNIDVVRRGVELVLQALIESELTAEIGAEPLERSEAPTNQPHEGVPERHHPRADKVSPNAGRGRGKA